MIRFFLAILVFFGAMALAGIYLQTGLAGAAAIGTLCFLLALSTFK